MFNVVLASNPQTVLMTLGSVDEAIAAEAGGFRIQGTTRADVDALVAWRIADNPDLNMKPGKDCELVKYRTKTGKFMLCEVLRVFNPDDEGYPRNCEVRSFAFPDSSFIASVDSCEIIAESSLPSELMKALRSGVTNQEEVGNGNNKLKHGLRRSA